MNKRGSHADWAISMGIFLVYILILFIIIRPGVEPVHDESNLLDLVEEKFNEEVKWIVKMSPLFVRTCKATERNEPSTVTVEDKSGFWKFTKVKLPETEAAFGKYCVSIGSKFTLTCGGSDCPCGAGCPYVSDKIFRLYYTPKGLEYIEENYPELRLDSKGESNAELGSSENLKGIYEKWLSNFKSKDYETVKEDWNFPESRDFSISVNKGEIIGGKPYEQANVFVREWSDWEVKENGERKEVKVNINVW